MNYIVILCQVVLAVVYFSAGISKVWQWFPNIIGPVWLIDELAKYQLGLFGYFIALAQALVGLLLFVPRLRLIAALLLLPMHLCVTVVPISLGWQGTPMVNLLLLTMLLTLLFDDRKKLLALVRDNASMPNNAEKICYWGSFILCWLLAIYLKYFWGLF